MSIGDLLKTDLNPRTLLLGLVALWLALFAGLSMFTGDAQKRLTSIRSEYTRASALVEKILDRQSVQGDLAGQPPLAAARKATADIKLEGALASIRETDTGGGEGVALYYEALDGRQLVELLKTLKHRTGLSVVECTINHRLDNPKRADMQLVMAR